jgi:hypothetical protein
MLVFPVLALAQIVATLGSDTICASSTRLQNPPSSLTPVNALAEKETAASAAQTLFNFFPSAPSEHHRREDDSTWGDSIHDDPGDLHRIYFQNIDGLRNDADEIALYVSSMAQLKIGTFCWADPGLDFSNPIVRQSLQRPIGKHFCTSRSAFSSSTLPPDSARLSGSTSGYQPGGTFMTTTDRWATRSTGTPLVDPSGLGRWSGLCYLGKRGKLLAIITAYRSPRQQPSGGFGFFDQQHSLLLSQGVSKPNVRKQFITDLVTFVNNLQSSGHEVIVSLDANEILGQDTTYMIMVFSQNTGASLSIWTSHHSWDRSKKLRHPKLEHFGQKINRRWTDILNLLRNMRMTIVYGIVLQI